MTFFAMEVVNGKITAWCQANMSPVPYIESYKQKKLLKIIKLLG